MYLAHFSSEVAPLSICWSSLDILIKTLHILMPILAFRIILEIYPFHLGFQIYKCRVVNDTFIFLKHLMFINFCFSFCILFASSLFLLIRFAGEFLLILLKNEC